MKTFILSNWNDNCKKKGLLFFAESMEEMLYHHSHDSFKVPTLNFKFLCYDILSAIDNINSDILEAGNLVPLIDELISFYEKDILVQEIYGDKIKKLFSQKNENGAYQNFFEDICKNRTSENTRSKLKNILTFIIEDLHNGNKYYKLLIHKIKSLVTREINIDEEKELYSLTQIFVTELVNKDYSLEYLYKSVINTFFSENMIIADSQKVFDDFISQFTFKDKQYAVYFPIPKSNKEDLTNCFNLKIEPNVYEMFDNKYEFIGKLEVEASDPEKARLITNSVINLFLSIIQFDKHRNMAFKLNKAEVIDLESKECFNLHEPILPIFRGNKSNKKTFSTNFCPHRIKNLFHAISLHASATQSKDINNQFLNLWTAIEVLVPIERKGSFSRINQICNYLTSVLSINYYRSLLIHLNSDLKVINELYCDCLKETGKEGTEGLFYIIADNSYRLTKEKLLAGLSDYPIINYKIQKYSELFVSPDKLLKTYENHSKRLRQQIMRIYRTRNMIVHDGTTTIYIELILQNLHYYVDTLIESINIIQSIGFNNITSIFKEIIQIEESLIKIFSSDSISVYDLEYIYRLNLYNN